MKTKEVNTKKQKKITKLQCVCPANPVGRLMEKIWLQSALAK